MRKQFPGYYRPKAEEFAQKFKECVFCFDTNVLLHLYRYTPESRDNLIKVLQAFKDRIWLPHQIGLELGCPKKPKITPNLLPSFRPS